MSYTGFVRVEKTDAYREWLDALRDRAGRARIQRETSLLLLLAGGDKSTQQKDIALAIHWAKNFQE